MTAPGNAENTARTDNDKLTELVDSATDAAELASREADLAAQLFDNDDIQAVAIAASESWHAARTIADAVRAHCANYLDVALELDALGSPEDDQPDP